MGRILDKDASPTGRPPGATRAALVIFVMVGVMVGVVLGPAGAADGATRCGGSKTAAFSGGIKVRGTFTTEERAEIERLKDTLTADLTKEGIDRTLIDGLFNEERATFGLYDAVGPLFKSNPEKKADSGEREYEWYRDCLNLDGKVKAAKSFIRRNEDLLREVESRYGVDKRIVASILGIESSFGTDRGRFNAVSALLSQYVLVERRRSFALRELKELVRYYDKRARGDTDWGEGSEGDQIGELRSSYAGAIGCGQFIPSSLNYYFVGKRGKIERADPFDIEDCLYSIAYYLKSSGWKRGGEKGEIARGSKRWRAIRAYNHSDAYVRFVIEIAEGTKR